MTTAWGWVGACGNDTRATKGGGEPNTNVIEYITVASPGNATDFGDLTAARRYTSACSGD